MSKSKGQWVLLHGRTIGEKAKNLAEGEVRCDCGRLLVRLTSQGLELRCPRCKLTVTFQLKDFENENLS
jgi:hypothetical protein